MEYEVSFTFFIESGTKEGIEMKDTLLEELDTIPQIFVYDVYDDGEDWCIDCIAEVICDTIENVDSNMSNLLKNTEVCWDYHYIKGIDNNDYWQP